MSGGAAGAAGLLSAADATANVYYLADGLSLQIIGLFYGSISIRLLKFNMHFQYRLLTPKRLTTCILGDLTWSGTTHYRGPC
jgi:hypothetical protein